MLAFELFYCALLIKLAVDSMALLAVILTSAEGIFMLFGYIVVLILFCFRIWLEIAIKEEYQNLDLQIDNPLNNGEPHFNG